MFEKLRTNGFQIEFHSHAEAILGVDFPEVAEQLEAILSGAMIPIDEIVASGGGETKSTQRLRRAPEDRGWIKHRFEIQRTIDGIARESISHEIDHVARFEAGVVALEIEWNNKDPFFDRDLENFKRLHSDGAISLGILITRGISMQDKMRSMVHRYAMARDIEDKSDLERIGLSPTRRQLREYARRRRGETSFAQAWAAAFVQDKFGAATTHWRKLEDRVNRGVGNPCPLLLIGLPASLVTFDHASGDSKNPIEEGGPSAE
jgi:Restriction endonuclease BglII